MGTGWLKHLIVNAAWHLERANQSITGFGARIAEALAARPIQDWEADRWGRGLKRRLIKLEGHFFRVGVRKSGSLSFFVRNEAGINVGLRRESITQAATFVSLITDYGYARDVTRFETGWMDVAVFNPDRKAIIYAENKARAGTLEKMCLRLESEFKSSIPFAAKGEADVDDVLMKANHIWRHRPRYFWGVAPTCRYSYEVQYTPLGFTLISIRDVPGYGTS